MHANSSSTNASYSTVFKSNKEFKCSGVAMTLLKGRTANETTSIGTAEKTFMYLF
jgi:hypothetical protein